MPPATVVLPPPETSTSVPTTAGALPLTSTTTVKKQPDDSESVRLMKEWMKKLVSEERATEFFARIADKLKREEAESRLTPLEILPRPLTLTETPTAQSLSTQKELSKTLPSTLSDKTTATPSISQVDPYSIAPNLSPTKSPTRGDEVNQQVNEEETKEEGEAGNEEVDTKSEENGGAEEAEGEEESQAEESDDEEKEGEAENSQARREKEEENVEGSKETEVAEEETTEVLGNEGESKEKEDEPEVEGDLMEILLLVEDTPTDERPERRNYRMSRRLDEVIAAKRARRMNLSDLDEEEETGDDIPEAQETTAGTDEAAPEDVEERYAAERKRKGKQAAKPLKKKP